MRMEVIENGRPVPKELHSAVLVGASDRFRARQQSRIQGRVSRLPPALDRSSVSRAMLMVEIRLVKAFWTIARQPLGSAMPLDQRRNGISYFHDRADTHARYADAPGGKWEMIAPRPSLPSSKDIDAANEALDWLLLIEEVELRKILVIGATSKRGDAGRRIGWIRLRGGLPQYAEMTVRTLQRRYQEALRIIVTEMTIARMSHVSHKQP
jgi:hypothetical protein